MQQLTNKKNNVQEVGVKFYVYILYMLYQTWSAVTYNLQLLDFKVQIIFRFVPNPLCNRSKVRLPEV